MEGIIIKGKHMHQFKQAISWTCLVNKEAIWVCQITITIICCHGESLKATYELSDIQYMIAFRAQLLLFPCFWTALWPWIFWAGTQEGCIKKELLNIDIFFSFSSVIEHQDKCQKFIYPVEADPEKVLHQVQVHSKGDRGKEARNFSSWSKN